MSKPRKIILLHHRAFGDSVVLSGLVRDIALTRPEVQVDVSCNYSDVFAHNPHLTPLKSNKPQAGVEYVKLSYGKGLKEQSRETIHFMPYFHRAFFQKTGIRVPLTLPYPDLHLSPVEKVRSLKGRYWVLNCGGKSDCTVKTWYHRSWHELIQRLNAQGLTCVQIGVTKDGHYHPDIPGTINMIGKTNPRELIRLIAHADGVICGITATMHIAAALQRPCVVIAGAREEWWWEAYVPENAGLGGEAVVRQLRIPHRYLHTITTLPCCQTKACWKNVVVPLNDKKGVCDRPIHLPGQPVPECLTTITVDQVETAVLSYYLDGTLPPPVGTPIEQEVQHILGKDPTWSGEVMQPIPRSVLPSVIDVVMGLSSASRSTGAIPRL